MLIKQLKRTNQVGTVKGQSFYKQVESAKQVNGAHDYNLPVYR